MPGRHQQLPSRRVGIRLLAGSLGLALAAASAGIALLLAGPASATPTPSYHAGSDTATFAVTGVLDHNCPVSVGGTEVWIKPGDAINFDSSAVGINVSVVDGLLTGIIGKVVGLNVTATVDPGTTHAQNVTVIGGKTTNFANAKNLSAGTHKLNWTATSLAVLPQVLPGLLGSLTNVPLSSNELNAGASLKWGGVIHVTNDAPQCKLSVGTPEVNVHVGPVKATVPPLNVNVPIPDLPSLPRLPGLPGGGTGGGGGGTGGGGGGSSGGGGGGHYQPPPVTVPEQVMGNIGGGGVAPNGGGSTQIGTGLPDQPGVASTGKTDPQSANNAQGKSKTATRLGTKYAANKAPAAQLPVLLAIVAIIALSLVTATYARLYLLRRNV
jgi:uncharacterized membrane protein YgcG